MLSVRPFLDVCWHTTVRLSFVQFLNVSWARIASYLIYVCPYVSHFKHPDPPHVSYPM